MTDLYPFQDAGRKFLASRRRALLLDEQGLGKTPQALRAMDGAPTLVVCPASVRQVWRREAVRFSPSAARLTLAPPGLLTRWPERGEILVCSYEALPPTPSEVAWGRALEEMGHWFRRLAGMPVLNVREEVIGPAPPDLLLVGDELHFVKDRKSRRTRRWLGAAQQAGRIWGLTGTPLLKVPTDLWNVLDAVGLSWPTFGTWERFVELCGGRRERLLFGHKTVERTVWDQPISVEVPHLLRMHTLRRTRAEVLPELPDKTVEVLTEERMAHVKPRLLKVLDRVWRTLEAESGKRRDQDPADWMPNIEGMSEARQIMASAKLPLAVELASEAGGPVVVWSAHVAPLEELGRLSGWAKLTGSDSEKVRTERVDAFQRGDLLGLACSIAAAGVGITLTRSCRAIFVDRHWQAAANEQAEDRLCRIGQKNAVLVTVIELDHPLDRRVSEVCARKTEMARQILGGVR